MILLCGCKNPYQDKRYGPGLRVHNERKDHNYRCTVCGAVRSG